MRSIHLQDAVRDRILCMHICGIRIVHAHFEQEAQMLRGLINDHILHLRDCLLICSSLLVTLSAGFSAYFLSGKKTDIRVRVMLGFSVCAVLFLACPVTAAVLRMVTGTYYDSPDMWNVLPLIPLGAIMTSVLFDELYSREKKLSVNKR